MHFLFLTTTLNTARLVLCRIQWEKSIGTNTFWLDCSLYLWCFLFLKCLSIGLPRNASTCVSSCMLEVNEPDLDAEPDLDLGPDWSRSLTQSQSRSLIDLHKHRIKVHVLDFSRQRVQSALTDLAQQETKGKNLGKQRPKRDGKVTWSHQPLLLSDFCYSEYHLQLGSEILDLLVLQYWVFS